MSEINLLPKEIQNNKSNNRWGRSLKITSIIFLLLMLVVSTIFWGLSFLTSRNVKIQEAKIAGVTSALMATSDFEKDVVKLGTKAQTLTTILKTQPRYFVLLNSLSSKVPLDIKITEITILSPTKTTVGGVSTSYLSLSQFLKVLSVSQDNIFSGVTLNNVVLDSVTSQVRFTMELAVKETSLTN